MSENQPAGIVPLEYMEQQLLAVLFAAGDPIELERLAQTFALSVEEMQQSIDGLRTKLEQMGLPLELLRLEQSVQLAAKSEFSPVIQAALDVRKNTPLSQAMMEVLAIIAYNQPVTRAFIDQVRGVDSSYSVNTLVTKGLVEEAGRLELPGRPIAYRTTQTFLRSFGLQSLEELPDVTKAGPDEE